MPDDFVKRALASAKNTLADANRFQASVRGPERPSPKPAAPASPAPSSGIGKEASDAAAGIKYRSEQAKALGSFKKGGTVPKTGLYQLHKDEKVIPAKDNKDAKAPAKSEAKPEMKKAMMDKATSGLGGGKKPKHGVRSTHIDHHHDGSHTVRHQMHSSPDKMGMDDSERSYAVANSGDLVSRLKEMLGAEEAEKQAAPSSAAPAPAAAAPQMP